MVIRRWRPGEEKILWDLFYNTVRNINIADYSDSQIHAWASDNYSKQMWEYRIRNIDPFVVILDNIIVGYSSIDATGYIDHFYCHHAYQKQGIGRAMIDNIFLEVKKYNIKKLTTNASITAKPFFKHFGFIVTKKQLVLVRGEYLKNFVMEKNFS